MYFFLLCIFNNKMNSNIVKDPIWYKNVDILFSKNRLDEFFPTKDQTLEEKLNAIMRLSVYISILLSVYNKNYKYLYVAFGMGLLTYFAYSQYSQNSNNTNLQSTNVENTLENLDMNMENEVNCTKPSLDNPIMNVTMKDYMNIQDGEIVDRPPACDISDPEIKREADEMFNNNLYKNIDDVFGKMNSQRQFFTMPWTTIPNDQDSFAKWLYDSPKTCKEDQDYCLRYEDLRANRPVVYNEEENPVSTKRFE